MARYPGCIGSCPPGAPSWRATLSDSMNAKSLVVLLALVVGAVIATLFAMRGDDAAPMPPAGASGQADRAAETAALAQGTAGADQVATAAPGDVHRTAAPVADASKGVASAATIRGRLVDKQGAPRAGVELALTTWPGFDGFEFEAMPDLPRRDRGKQDRPTFTTRADGTFTFTLAKDRSGAITLEASELVFAKWPPQVSGKKGDQDLGDVVALRSGVVEGIVQDEQGRPVADVKVAVSTGELGFGTTSSATSGSDGRFKLGKLQPGRLTIRTASGKFLPTVQELELQDEEQRGDLVLVVRPGNAIAGQVVDDRGVGVPDMKVGSKRKEVHGAVDIERFTPDEATTTDRNGFFTLSGLSEEAATVRAFGPGHSSAVAADVAVGTGNLVLRVERYGIVEGVLQGQDGTPIAGSRVRAQRDGVPVDADEPFAMWSIDGVPETAGRGAVTAADGTFRLESVKPGAVTLAARGPMHQPVQQPGINVLPAQTTKGVRLVADLGAIARVKVVDEAGKPVADAQVRAKRVSERGPSDGTRVEMRGVAMEDHGSGPEIMIGGDRPASAKTDDDGIAVLHALPAGQLELTATHADYAPAGAVRVTTPRSGTVEADLQLRTPGHAVITVLGTDGSPQAGVELRVSSRREDGQPGKTVTSDGKGEARVASLAPGPYEAALRRPNQATRVGDSMMMFGDDQEVIASSAQPFTIVAGETVRVELRRPLLARVHGTVTGADGPVAGCVIELVRDEGGGLGVPGFSGRQATTAADGTFAIDEVESGACRLHFGKPNQVVKATVDIVVPPDTPDVRQDLELRTGTLRVQVVADATGEPIAKAVVEVERGESASATGKTVRRARVAFVTAAVNDSGEGSPEMTSMTLGVQRAHTDDSGVATIEDVPAGEYTLRVTHKKYAPAELKGQVVAERRLTDAGRVGLTGAGQVRGKVLGTDGKQARMAMVQHRKAGTEEPWGQPTLAMNGSYNITGLAAGKYSLRARQLGPQDGAFSPEVEIDVKAGETATSDLQLPK